jgi:hygromycin-B 7''-O-kinase
MGFKKSIVKRREAVKMKRPSISTKDEYIQYFTDVEFWREYVTMVCEKHKLHPINEINAGLPGTNPVFIVDNHYAIKFFTSFFNGYQSYDKELELFGIIKMYSTLPAPSLISSGSLFPKGSEWNWPYIVTKVVPGTSLGEVLDQVSFENMKVLAGFLADVLKDVHALPIKNSVVLPHSWESFTTFVNHQQQNCARNHKAWNTLPPHLIFQIEDYLMPKASLVLMENEPSIIHCDLNSDHVLGDFKSGSWQPSGIIDFGDAKVGDRIYDLVALHIGLFNCDKRLLKQFLEVYGRDEELENYFVKRAMNYTLLHEFDVLLPLFEQHPQLSKLTTLEELAQRIWNVDYRKDIYTVE